MANDKFWIWHKPDSLLLDNVRDYKMEDHNILENKKYKDLIFIISRLIISIICPVHLIVLDTWNI